MHLFLVTVTCLVNMACPIPDKSISIAIKAKDVVDCKAKAENTMPAFGLDPKKFIIKCEERK